MDKKRTNSVEDETKNMQALKSTNHNKIEEII